MYFENPHLHNLSQQRKAIEEMETTTQYVARQPLGEQFRRTFHLRE